MEIPVWSSGSDRTQRGKKEVKRLQLLWVTAPSWVLLKTTTTTTNKIVLSVQVAIMKKGIN